MKRVPEPLPRDAHTRKRVCITDYLKPAPVPSFREKADTSTALSSLEEMENRREESSRLSAACRERGDFDIFQFLQENFQPEEAAAAAQESPREPVAHIRLADFYRPQREVACICAATSLDQPAAARRARALGLLRYHHYASAEGGEDASVLALSSLLEEFDGAEKREFCLSMGDLEAWGLRDHARVAELAGLPPDQLERRSRYLLLALRNRDNLLFRRFADLAVPKTALPAAERAGRLLFAGAAVFFAAQAMLDIAFTGIVSGFAVAANFGFAQSSTQQVSLEVAPFRGDAVLSSDLLVFDGPPKEKWAVEAEALGPRAARHMQEFEEHLDKCVITLRPGLGGRLLESHVRFVATNAKNARFLFSC